MTSLGKRAPVSWCRAVEGVRMALGAQRRTVVRMMMSESIRLVAIGIVRGPGAGLWAGRFVQTVVYGLSPSDPLTIIGAVALIAIVTALGRNAAPGARRGGPVFCGLADSPQGVTGADDAEAGSDGRLYSSCRL